MTDRKPTSRGPVLIEMLAPSSLTPASAPPPGDDGPKGQAMQSVAGFAAKPVSYLSRFFWATAASLAGFAVSLAAWRFVTGLLDANPVLGAIASVLVLAFILAAVLVALREYSAFARLARIDHINKEAVAAVASGDIDQAKRVASRVSTLYRSRPDLAWGLARLAERLGDVHDADTVLALAETELMAPLDLAARAEVEAAARRVAAVTALVPLALADVATALVVNLRMVRRIAEIYGGRSGAFGGWRLLRAVIRHLVATGAVAVGDDLIQSIAGGGLLSKVSRRFGEGVVNGALTARVGVAAIDICRPLPFAALPRPRVSNLVSRGLAGLFGSATRSETTGRNS